MLCVYVYCVLLSICNTLIFLCTGDINVCENNNNNDNNNNNINNNNYNNNNIED